MMDEKNFYTLYSEHLKTLYGEKVYKLPVQIPVTCPNRMGSQRGCTFCSEVGTGFEALENTISITEQLNLTRMKIEKKYNAHKFIVYFQNFTNTFCSLDVFKKAIKEAIEFPDIVEISISTRPDCIHDDYLQFLSEISSESGIQITIELGLQTINYHTLKKINRGHGLAEYVDAVLRIAKYNTFFIGTHMILNFPYNTIEDEKEAVRFLSALPIHIVKFHSLYIPNHTQLYEEYKNGEITLCSKEEYLECLTECIALLRKDIVVERLFSRVPEEYSAFSNWNTSWWKLKEEFLFLMEKKGYTQGCHCNYLNGSALKKWRIYDGK